ncbi:serotransferrin-like isoform X1 [Octopus vulgaris]|uniref:Serotransferrin-like isoform X1 n=1 Tax=Octopus vulgaris TaxID=6645 RepID=A0AA36BU82_OCTVU|nr:serotransferrin-like isoform X1 [Octopus vulgaris]
MASSGPFQLLLLIILASFAEASEPRLCVTSEKERQKCKTFQNITCVKGSSASDCLEKIAKNLADITSLDGGNIYKAGKCYNLKPIVAETYSGLPIGAGYFAVAVAKKSSNVNINTLQGKISCHTGLNKTAGWFIPMSVLFTNKNNQLTQASNFFNASCVPGAINGSNMCRLCTPNCKRNSDNFYYGYNGAAKCLMETEADVAFVKHSTFLKELTKSDYELLCADGSTAEIGDYEQCHLAQVPPHAIVGRNNLTDDQIEEIFENFDSKSNSTLFSDKFGKNLIFSSGTESLIEILSHYEAFLGPSYMNALPDISC